MWDREQIAEGTELVRACAVLATHSVRTRIQAAISAVHAEATTAAATDWNEIVGLTTC